MPLKSQIFPCLDELDPLCARSQACNTVTNHSGILRGFNTEYAGAKSVIHRANPKIALFFRMGAAAKVLVQVLKDLRVSSIYSAGRNPTNIECFVRSTGASIYRSKEVGTYDLFINATPLNLSPLAAEVVSLIKLASSIFDLIVSKTPTSLEVWAKSRGKEFFPRYEISIIQLIEQFRLYLGFRPEAEEVREVLQTQYLQA